MEIKLVDTARENFENLKVSLDTANAERRLRNALFKLRKTRKKLSLDFGIDMLKDAKYIYDSAAVEQTSYGNTEIFTGMVETLDTVEQVIGNVSVLLFDHEINGLSNILVTLCDTDFDHISKIDFGITNSINRILE